MTLTASAVANCFSRQVKLASYSPTLPRTLPPSFRGVARHACQNCFRGLPRACFGYSRFRGHCVAVGQKPSAGLRRGKAFRLRLRSPNRQDANRWNPPKLSVAVSVRRHDRTRQKLARELARCNLERACFCDSTFRQTSATKGNQRLPRAT